MLAMRGIKRGALVLLDGKTEGADGSGSLALGRSRDAVLHCTYCEQSGQGITDIGLDGFPSVSMPSLLGA
jgi:hypothetical protein